MSEDNGKPQSDTPKRSNGNGSTRINPKPEVLNNREIKIAKAEINAKIRRKEFADARKKLRLLLKYEDKDTEIKELRKKLGI